MVNHLSFQDDTTEANKPAQKTRFKKYTKTRRKKVEKPPSPKKTWWRKNSLYQLLCCQNTCYSVALYFALALFIALFVYAVWKICDLRFAHNGQKRPQGTKDHTSKPYIQSNNDDIGRNRFYPDKAKTLKYVHRKPVSTTLKPVTKNNDIRKLGTIDKNYNSFPQTTTQNDFNRMTSQENRFHNVKSETLPQDTSYHRYFQGDKRYMIPPSPSRLQYNSPFEASGGDTVEEWRAMRLALLKNRLKLTTGSSNPTDNPYWKSLLLRTQIPANPYLSPYNVNQEKNPSNVSPVHDDGILQPTTVAVTYPQMQTIKIAQDPASIVSKHSEIQSIDTNSSFAKGYTKLLTDLFNKMVALRTPNNQAAIASSSLFNSGLGTASNQNFSFGRNITNSSRPLITEKITSYQNRTRQIVGPLSYNNTHPLQNLQLTNLTTTRKPTTTTRFQIPIAVAKNIGETSKNFKTINKTKSHRKRRKHLKAEISGLHPSANKKHRSKIMQNSKKNRDDRKANRHKLKTSSKHLKHQKLHHSRSKAFKLKKFGKTENSDLETTVTDGASLFSSGSGGSSGSSSGFYGISMHSGSGDGSGDNSGEGEQSLNVRNEHISKSSSSYKRSSKSRLKKKTYVGLKEKLMKLKKKHKKDKGMMHHTKSKKHHEDGHINEHSIGSKKHHTNHHDKTHKHDKEGRLKSRKRSKSEHSEHKIKSINKKHDHEGKHMKNTKKHSNKHKYMKIIQQKLKRLKKKHEIAKHLSNVQKKLAELEKRKKINKRHKKHDAPKKPKSLEMPARKNDVPKHWQTGVVKIKDCSVVKQFDKKHYVGINLYKKEGDKHVYAVTDCLLKKGFHHRYKCRKLFYKTAGYMALKRSEKKGRSKLYLMLCRHESSLKRVMNKKIEGISKAVIMSKKNNDNEDDDDDNDDVDVNNSNDDDDDGDIEKKGSKRSSVLHKQKHSSHDKSNKKRAERKMKDHSSKRKKSRKHDHSHHRKINKHNSHRHSRHNKRHKHSRHHHKGEDMDDEDKAATGDTNASGSGDNDVDGSGDVEIRFERSTASNSKTQHKKSSHKKWKSKHDKHKVDHEKLHKHGPEDTTIYAKFFDMMKEMKQEIQNVTTRNFGQKSTDKLKINFNASVTSNSSAHMPSNAINENKTILDAKQKNDSQLNVQKNVSIKSQNQTKFESIQDMVSKIVPAIMQQFEAKTVKSNPTDKMKKLAPVPTMSTTAVKVGTTKKPRSTPKTTSTTPRPPTKKHFKPTTSSIGKDHTRAHTPTKHVTMHHTSPRHTTHHHPTTNRASKSHAKTTQAPNIAMILKGLKALGLSQMTQHVPTKKPSIQQKSVIPSIPHTNMLKKPKSPTKNVPTKQQPLPPPIPKPLPLHNPFQMQLLCFGDSLTAGYHNHGKAFSPYGNYLRQLINLSSRTPASVEIKGIVGEMTHKQMAARLPEVLGNSSVFDWVIILGGTNDILHVKNFADDQEFLSQLENVWQPRITKDIEKLHDTAHKYGAHSMLLTVPENSIELWPGYKILLTMRKKINNALRQYAEQHRDKIALCDIAQKLPRHSLTQQQETIFWDDHLHMTERGYHRMAEEVFKCLKPYLPKK